MGPLIAYNDQGEVVATLDHMVARDEEGRVVGLIDFEAHELAGGEMTDVWRVQNAKGSKVWPEWLGGQAHLFRVELEGPPGRKRIAALVHIGQAESNDAEGNVLPAIPASGHRRERAQIEAAIAERIAKANGEPADIRDIVGGPDRPLRLDDEGGTGSRVPRKPRPNLPLLRRPAITGQPTVEPREEAQGKGQPLR